jgi:hypothetical protein
MLFRKQKGCCAGLQLLAHFFQRGAANTIDARLS